MLNYSNNHVHTHKGSNQRMLDCINKIDDLVDYSIELGYKSITITDHNSLSSHVDCMKKNTELQEKGIDFKIYLGDEIYLVDSLEETRDNYQGGGITKFPHFILIAKDLIGYRQLREIDSRAWDNSFMTGKMRRVPISKQELKDIIGDKKGHLSATSACLGSELAILFKQYEQEPTKENKLPIHHFVMYCKDLFGDNFAFELQPSNSMEQIKYNCFLMQLSEAYKVKCVIATDAHYIRKEDKPIHKAFITSRQADRGEGEDFYATTYLLGIEEMWEYFKEYMDRNQFEIYINNSYKLVSDNKIIDMKHKIIIPERDLSGIEFEVSHIFKQWYSQYEYINNFAHSEYVQDRYLLYMIEQGFLEKNEEFNETNINRINTEFKELWVISEMLQDRMSAYYNLVDYIVDIVWTIGFLGVSRGSVTGYYTMWLIDMHQMNPIEWKLPHWRHLNSSRVSFPKQHWGLKVNLAYRVCA